MCVISAYNPDAVPPKVSPPEKVGPAAGAPKPVNVVAAGLSAFDCPNDPNPDVLVAPNEPKPPNPVAVDAAGAPNADVVPNPVAGF